MLFWLSTNFVIIHSHARTHTHHTYTTHTHTHTHIHTYPHQHAHPHFLSLSLSHTHTHTHTHTPPPHTHTYSYLDRLTDSLLHHLKLANKATSQAQFYATRRDEAITTAINTEPKLTALVAETKELQAQVSHFVWACVCCVLVCQNLELNL